MDNLLNYPVDILSDRLQQIIDSDECPRCYCSLQITEGKGNHYAQLKCTHSDTPHWIDWLPNPQNKDKSRRESNHRNLVSRYSQGFCECCMRKAEDLPKPQQLEAHHVIEHKDGGTDDRSNIWIVCTPCHKQIHHNRTYLGHYQQSA